MSTGDRIYFVLLTRIGIVGAVVFAIDAGRGLRKRPWTEQTKRAMFGAAKRGSWDANWGWDHR
jgi:hypothetical protein